MWRLRNTNRREHWRRGQRWRTTTWLRFREIATKTGYTTGSRILNVRRLLFLRPPMNLLPKTSSRWTVTSGELDHWGKPTVISKRGNREFYFCRGSRGGRRIWICWERCRLFFSAVLQAPPRADAEEAARVASSELKRLEPSLDVYLDLASEESGVPDAEPGTPPNGGPATPPDNSGVASGPPSVS